MTESKKKTITKKLEEIKNNFFLPEVSCNLMAIKLTWRKRGDILKNIQIKHIK